MAILVLVCVTFLAVILGHNLINLRAGGGVQGLFILYVLLLLIGGGFFTSTNLGDLKTVTSRVRYISLPASTTEKLIAKWLYTLPLYAGGISLIIWLFFKGYMSVYGTLLPPEALEISDKLSTKMPLYFIRLYVFGHAIAFFFSFFFNTYASIKGALISIGLSITISALRSFIIQDRGLGLLESVGQSIFEMMEWLSMHPNELMIVAPIFYIMSYQVLKKKSV